MAHITGPGFPAASGADRQAVRKRLRFYGTVQGVGFRYRAVHAARLTGATGWVRNEDDGSVCMEIQGTEAQIDRVIEMIQAGRYVQVDRIDARALPLQPEERDFKTREYDW